MPISTALPPATLEYLLYMWYPSLEVRNTGANIGNVAISSQRPQPWQGNTAIPPAFGAVFAIGTGGVVQQFRIFKGRPVAQWSMTLGGYNPNGQGWVMGHWMPSYGPAAGMNPGAFSANEAALVAVIDFHVAMQATTLMGDDRCGFMFLPFAGTNNIRSTPGNPVGAQAGGFGVFVNDDGAGASTLEYVSWSDGNPAPILQRQTLIGQIPDLTDWTTVRFIIVGATPTSEAILSVRCNDQPVPNLTGVEFGSAELLRPEDAEVIASANAYGFAVAIADVGGASNDMNFQVGAKWGRFTPDGAAQQAI